MHQPTADLIESPVVMLPPVDLSGGDADAEIVVLTDIHVGASDFLEKVWERDKAYILGCDPAKTRVLILGDLLQMDTKFVKHSDVYNQVLNPEQQVERAVEELRPLKPYIDLLLTGNHDARVIDAVGVDPVKFIATEVGLREQHVKDNAVVVYKVGNQPHGRDNNPRPVIYTVYCHHGEGTGNSDNSLLRAVGKVPNADLYLSGHIHQRKTIYSTAQIIDTRTAKLTYKRRVVAVVPSYQGGAGWTTRRNFQDSDFGMGRFELCARHRFVRALDTIG